jgi:LPXTG-site transpeptidase (sortase) family protein
MDPAVIGRAEVLITILNARPELVAKVDSYRQRRSKLPLFLDVPSDDPLAPFAEAAFAAGITSGFADRTLRPNEGVPAEEAVSMVMRAFGIAGEKQPGDTQEFVPLVRAALSRHLLADPVSMAVGQPITRGQLLDLISRTTVVTRDHLDRFPEPVAPAPVYVAPPTPVIEQQPVQQVQAPAVSAVRAVPQIQQVPQAPSSSSQQNILQYATPQNFGITIPKLGIKNLGISHPADALTSKGLLAPLQSGVGHLFAYPGNGGKIMVYGHSSGYAWDESKFTKIFTQVNKLKSGDRVYVTYNGAVFEYAVTGQQTISPTDASPFAGGPEELILYTCWPPNSTKSRLIIRAVPVQTVALR